jgi:SAM-dependent methyltransferase
MTGKIQQSLVNFFENSRSPKQPERSFEMQSFRHSPTSEPAPQTTGRTIHWASHYDLATRLLFLGKEQAMRNMTLDLAGIEPGEVVLDVGCGTGNLTIGAVGRVGPTGHVHGIDAAPEMIEVACGKAEKAGVKAGVEVDFRVGLIEDIPFPDDHFDLVLSSLMLHHLPLDLKGQGFLEIGRVLKPGGRFLAVDFSPPTKGWLGHLATHLFGHSLEGANLQELTAMLEEAGFSEVEAGTTQFKVLAFLRGRKE